MTENTHTRYQILDSYRFKLVQILRYLTVPNERIKDDDIRQRSQLLASMILVILPLMVIVGLVVMPTYSDADQYMRAPTVIPATSAIVTSILAFVLNRVGYYQIAAGLYIAIFVAAPIAVITYNSHPQNVPIATLAVGGVILAATLYAGWIAPMVAALASCSGVFLIALILPDITFGAVAGVLSVNVTLAMLLIIFTSHQMALSRKKREALTASLRYSGSRIDEMMDVIIAIASLDFGARASISDNGDEYDALATGLNALSEELEASTVSRDFLSSIIEAMQDSLIVTDNTNAITMVNQSAEAMLGYSQSELIGQPLTQVLDKETKLEKLVSSLQERSFQTQDGRLIPISFSAAALRDGDGMLNGLVCVARDITERKQAEEALQASEARLREAQSIAHIGNWEWDVVTDEVYWSDELYHILGYRPQEIDVDSNTFAKLVHPDDRDHIENAVADTVRGQLYNEEHRVVHPGGQVRWVEQQGRMEFDENGQALRMVGTTQDITERKEAEIMLRSSQNRLELALGAAKAGVWEWNSDTDQVYWSEDIYRMMGFTPHSVDPNYDTWLNAIHPEDRLESDALVKAHMKNLSDLNMEFRVFGQDGSTRWISNIAKTRFDKSERRTGTYGIQMDITERKQAEEAIRQLNEELEQRVLERTKELEDANAEIRHFAYIVSHDLRAPLVNLKGFAAELRTSLDVMKGACDQFMALVEPSQADMLAQALNDDIPEALRFIESSVNTMDSFTKAMLKLSRLGRLHLDIQQINTRSIVENIFHGLSHQIKQQAIKVKVGDLPDLYADLVSIEQIFSNILSNAVAYLIPDRPGEIEVSAEQMPDEIVFHIRDNGRGIAPEDMDKVFAPFRRAGRQDVPGEGMGLAYVQALIRRHGGQIWCDSEVNAGTTFSFTIPEPSTSNNHGHT